MGHLDYKGEVKEGYHSRIPTNNMNEFNFIEGSVSQRSRNPHEVTGQLSEMFGGSNFTSENLLIGHSIKQPPHTLVTQQDHYKTTKVNLYGNHPYTSTNNRRKDIMNRQKSPISAAQNKVTT